MTTRAEGHAVAIDRINRPRLAMEEAGGWKVSWASYAVKVKRPLRLTSAPV